MFTHPYISLSVKTPLEKSLYQKWFKAVSEQGQSGIVSSCELDGKGKQIRFYHTVIKKKHYYVVVLARNLDTDEATKVAKEFKKQMSDGTFEINWSQIPSSNWKKTEKVGDELLQTLILEAAKRSHSKWLDRKMNEGWRFGQKFNNLDKTTPMCRNWDNLPDSYKMQECERISSLLEVIEEMKLTLSTKK